jgi:hypothetical protein
MFYFWCSFAYILFMYYCITAIFMFEESDTQNVTFYQHLNCVDCCRVYPTSEFLVVLIVIQLIYSTMISIPVFNKNHLMV